MYRLKAKGGSASQSRTGGGGGVQVGAGVGVIIAVAVAAAGWCLEAAVAQELPRRSRTLTHCSSESRD